MSLFSRGGSAVVFAATGQKSRGRVLMSYLSGKLLREDRSSVRGHTNLQECRAMVRVWNEAGFEVHAVDFADETYCPQGSFFAFSDIHSNLERWDTGAECRRLLHITGAHWLTHNRSEMSRLENLRERRGKSLLPRRQSQPSYGIENAVRATCLGNEFTSGTFSYAQKPVDRIPISSVYQWDWPDSRRVGEIQRHFLFMGSFGMVHRGLDLVLEAFAQRPDLKLTVCGRPEKEEDFFNLYRKELTQTPSIHFAGWVDPASLEFDQIRQTHGSMIYPSAAEGGGGALIHGMHAGLLPIATPEASVDIGEFGVPIAEGTVEAVGEAIEYVAGLPSAEFEARARASYDFARSHHTLDQFTAHYRAFVDYIIHG